MGSAVLRFGRLLIIVLDVLGGIVFRFHTLAQAKVTSISPNSFTELINAQLL